jgi:GDP/UDP-N,N'-diacetylbacillosamine 2-epimerase (hydrolysing)
MLSKDKFQITKILFKMSDKRKILVISGTRAEYGLMRWIIQYLHDDSDLELQIVATGMHLSPEFGLTFKTIIEDGFVINKKVEMLLSSDTSIGLSKSMGLGMISFAEVYNDLNPDVILVLGDRFEIFAAVASAMVSRIPVAHIHGGEATEGLIDEPIRHSITKMSHIHFTATEAYRNRVIQLGEQPDKVFYTGTPGLDNISKLRLYNKDEFEKSINFEIGEKCFLVTFHPVTLEKGTSAHQFDELLEAIEYFNDYKVIFTLPNADTDGRIVIEKIQQYVSLNSNKSVAFTSMGQIRYLSALKYVSMVIGNSSSGLTEVPSFKIPTINIGDRQKGRIKADSVIDCLPSKEEIIKSISLGLSLEFQSKLPNIQNPYGSGGASKKIVEILKNIDLKNVLKKQFHNII